jgi:hypothetical protein
MNGLRYTLDELLDTMRRHEIVRGLLLSPLLQGGAPLPNDEVIRLYRSSKGMLAPVITAEPTAKQVKAALKLAEENRKEVKAFKVRLGYTKAGPKARSSTGSTTMPNRRVSRYYSTLGTRHSAPGTSSALLIIEYETGEH